MGYNAAIDSVSPLLPRLSIAVTVAGHAGRSKRGTYAALSLRPTSADPDTASAVRQRNPSGQSVLPARPALVKLNRSSRFVEHLGEGYASDAAERGAERVALVARAAGDAGVVLMDVARF